MGNWNISFTKEYTSIDRTLSVDKSKARARGNTAVQNLQTSTLNWVRWIIPNDQMNTISQTQYQIVRGLVDIFIEAIAQYYYNGKTDFQVYDWNYTDTLPTYILLRIRRFMRHMQYLIDTKMEEILVKMWSM